MISRLANRLRQLRSRLGDESGAAAVEYGLLVVLVAGVIVAIVTTVGQHVSNAFSSVTGVFP